MNKCQENILKALHALEGKATINELVAFFATKGCKITYRKIYDNLFPLFKEKYVRCYFEPSKGDIFYINDKKGECIMKILECSSKGDKRFSAFYARVPVNGRWDSIEHHYQKCKKFNHPVSNPKGKQPDYISINGYKLDVRFLTPYYKLLWVKYLDNHPDLCRYASEFDDFHDMFKGKSVNCQADVIRQYIKKGRESILKECEEFIKIINGEG